jgi:hypothetical protein
MPAEGVWRDSDRSIRLMKRGDCLGRDFSCFRLCEFSTLRASNVASLWWPGSIFKISACGSVTRRYGSTSEKHLHYPESSLLDLSSVISMPVVSNTYRIRQKAMLWCSIPKMPSCFSPDHDHWWMVNL